GNTSKETPHEYQTSSFGAGPERELSCRARTGSSYARAISDEGGSQFSACAHRYASPRAFSRSASDVRPFPVARGNFAARKLASALFLRRTPKSLGGDLSDNYAGSAPRQPA